MRRFMILLVVGASLCMGGSAMAQGPSCVVAACTALICTALWLRDVVVPPVCYTRVRVRQLHHQQACCTHNRHRHHGCRPEQQRVLIRRGDLHDSC